ncbi:MAG TPA: sensor histidine kinase [Bacteroidia bacterium]|nr:sensor histidine kinase [Bacteroidia bacterium]
MFVDSIKYILKKVTDIGIDEQLPLYDKLRVRFVNGLHFLMVIILFIVLFLWVIFSKIFFTEIEFACVFLAIVGLILNKYKFYNASSILFYIYCNILLIVNIGAYPPETVGFVYYFPFAMVMSIVSFSKLRDRISYFFLFLSFILFVVVLFSENNSYLSSTFGISISESDIQWIRHFNVIFSGFCVVLFTYFYKWFSGIQTAELQKVVQKEKELNQQLIQSLNQREALLAEVHHRVKNNLALLNSMINMKLNNYESDDIETILNSLQDRIYNMSLVHNLFYAHENIDHIEISDFTKKITHSTLSNHNIKNVNVVENFDEIGTIRTSALIPFGIILNEIISNVAKHTLSLKPNATLNISIYKNDKDVIISIIDNGNGLKEYHKDGLGMELIKTLVEQLSGKVEFLNENGLHVKITIPMSEILI